MHRRIRQPIVFVPILIVLGIVGVWWLAFRPDDDATASATATKQVVEVTSGPMSETVSAEGTVAAAETDDLSFGSSGTVTAVNVKAGDQVTAGQVLATLDSAELEAAVSSAAATVADAEAKLADDEAAGASDEQIAADESSLEAANDSLVNATEDLAGAALVATFDGTVAGVNLTVGEELSSGGTGGTTSTGTDSGSGRTSDSLGAASIGAIPGGSDSAADDSGSTAQVQVVSAGRYTVELAVDSADIDQVAVGQSATVTLATSSSGGFPGGFPGAGGFALGGVPGAVTGNAGDSDAPDSDAPDSESSAGPPVASGAANTTGTVTEVGRVADASSGVATYPVTISFTASGDDFYVGSTVTGDISTNERANVVQVSALAITTVDGASTVTVAVNGTTTGPTETRTVTTGLNANGNTELTSGLEVGEKVIIAITRPGGTSGFSPPVGAFPGGGSGGFGAPTGSAG
jgi:macrolide-specific efflux system membrane fusion protein